MTSESPKAERLVLWYHLHGGAYDVSAERRGETPSTVQLSMGKLRLTRSEMLAFFCQQIKQDWVQRVFVDANTGIEHEISERTVSQIKSGQLHVQDLLIS